MRELRQLVILYSEAAGRKMPLSATTPLCGSLVEVASSINKPATRMEVLPTLVGIAVGAYPTPDNPNTAGGTGATYMSLNISGSAAANFTTGQFVTPQFGTDQAMAAQYSSYGLTQQSARMQLPGLTVA